MFHLWTRRRAPVQRPARTPRPLPALADDPEAPAPGCGWYESSHELARGLSVSTHEAGQAAPEWVPLGWWLQWELDNKPPAIALHDASHR